MELKEYLEEIKNFLKEYLAESRMDGYVLGLSGGIDSALVARLVQESVGNDKLTCIIMPCHSHEEDAKDALSFAQKFNINYKIIDLSSSFDEVEKSIKNVQNIEGLALHNIKVRLRMTTLFAIGQQLKCLVLGTDNWDENYVGYFTKYGDGAADLLPIVSLTKNEVREASKILGVNEEIINKNPTAGLFDGQTDEKEMGITYNQLDSFLLGNEIELEARTQIEHLHKISEHKRNPIPRPKPFDRKSTSLK